MMPNIWFDLCALCVLAALTGLYYFKFRVPFKKYRIFLLMIWLCLVSTAASLASNVLPGLAPLWLLRMTNTFYFLAHGLLLPALLLYVHSLTDNSLSNWKQLVPWLIPMAFSLLLILTGWYSDSLFWLDEGGWYHRGSMIWLLYLAAACYLVGILAHLAQSWHSIARREGVFILVFLGVNTAAVLFQFVFPRMQVENFACALCLMMSQMIVQDPEQLLDPNTGMLNKKGFSVFLTPMFDRRRSFQVGFILVDNYHELEKAYGFTRLESRMSVLTNFLKQHPGVIFARVDSGLYCFVQEGPRNIVEWMTLLQDLDEDALISRLHKRRIGVRVQMKTGLIECPQDAESFSTLMSLFDMAARMPMAKGEEAIRLTSVDVANLRRKKLIEELVRSAVRDNSLHMVYQPIYDIQANRFCSAEALMRMHTEQTGNVSPGEFIPIAEDNGAIVKLTRFAVEQVCSFLRSTDLRNMGLDWVNINLSAIDCAQKDLAEQLLRIMESCGVEPEMISTELTETAFTNLPDSVLSNLSGLSQAGVTIMLDDYGTGYSNLNRVCSMPLDVVKLDKSLVDHVCTSEPARVIMENTISMMKRLNKRVLVEGVETKEQADYLIGLGVDYIQGFYYARPMDAAHLEALFRGQLTAV